jgi:murein DD-endopeptidase MepM/ murein hydrolase activator NlpD
MYFPVEPYFKKELITSKFGNRSNPFSNTLQYHNGIDYGIPSGTLLLAPDDGIITKSWYDGNGGNQILIKHDNGYTTGYAHLTRAIKTTGQNVKAGEIFAESGNTGRSTGAHLHFTLRDKNSNLLDPADYNWQPVKKKNNKKGLVIILGLATAGIILYFYDKSLKKKK